MMHEATQVYSTRGEGSYLSAVHTSMANCPTPNQSAQIKVFHSNKKLSPVNINHSEVLSCWSFVYIYERPILGDNPKPLKILLKSTALFMELHFSGSCAFHWKVTKTADSTQISHYDQVVNRVQREGQLGISHILVVFGGACMCIWGMNAHICLHCVLNWLLSRPFDLILS